MPNASNTDRVVGALGEGAVDVTAERAIIAIQGPQARALLASVAPAAAEVGRFHVAALRVGTEPPAWSPAPATPARTASRSRSPPNGATELWEAVLDAGIQPAGLGARDNPAPSKQACRCNGHELGPGITPAAGRDSDGS